MDIEFTFIGWNNSVDSDGKKHDKVWTAFKAGDTYFAAWGARGKALSFKEYGTGWRAREEQNKVMEQKKNKKGYVDAGTDPFMMFSVFPYFKDELAKRFTFCTLTGKIK